MKINVSKLILSRVLLLVVPMTIVGSGAAYAAPFAIEDNVSLTTANVVGAAFVGQRIGRGPSTILSGGLTLGASATGVGDTDTLLISDIAFIPNLDSDQQLSATTGPYQVDETYEVVTIVDPPGFDPPYEVIETRRIVAEVSSLAYVSYSNLALDLSTLPSVLAIDGSTLATPYFQLGVLSGEIQVGVRIDLDGEVHSERMSSIVTFDTDLAARFTCGGSSSEPFCDLELTTSIGDRPWPNPNIEGNLQAGVTVDTQQLFGIPPFTLSVFRRISATSQVVVPEPNAAVLIGLGLCWISSRRRVRSR